MKIKIGYMLILMLVMALVGTGFTASNSELFVLDGYKPLTEQVWGSSVSSYPGQTGSFSVSGQAAHGLPVNDDDEDYVGSYFNIEQESYTSSGVTNRHIDISSAKTQGYLAEDVTVIGMARIKDVFTMENLAAGSNVAVNWWAIF